ncbi:MAG: PAC2 family protein [Candidatus Caldarchaeum sp.]|nr:PAC2 family protein [Candidatus Caldarchaeum sp.]
MLSYFLSDEPPVGAKYLVAGLPDMGNVAGIAVEHLVKVLGMKAFAVVRASWPPYVMHEKGRVVYRRSEFKFHKPVNLGGFVVFSGDYQPHEAGELYELTETVAEIAKRMALERVVTLGAAHRGGAATGRVLYASTNEELAKLAEEVGAVSLEDSGYITGFNGLLLGVGRELGMEGLCLLGEIDNPEIPQPKASKNVLKVLSKILGIEDLDTTALDEAAERIKAQIMFAEETARLRRQFRGSLPGVV